jgi:chemotaxis signal transduction protein
MNEGKRFLILSLLGEGYALPLTSLLEIITARRNIERDNNLGDAYEGIFRFRGAGIPVVDLKKIFRLEGPAGPVLLVLQSSRGAIGVLVDGVTEIIETDRKPVPLTEGVVPSGVRCYSGTLKHQDSLLLLLNEDGIATW